jgi:hypothetical protein
LDQAVGQAEEWKSLVGDAGAKCRQGQVGEGKPELAGQAGEVQAGGGLKLLDS